MENFVNFYQHIPGHLDPSLKIGFFSISWYSLMYLAAFATVYFFLKARIKKGELPEGLISIGQKPDDFLLSFLLYAFFGLIIGARLGEVLFYNPIYYISNPLAIVSPFNSSGNFVGIYGMSYHGGLLGALFAAYIFTRKNKINIWKLAEFVVPAVPAGYFFGRLGNFINSELYGRVTDKLWGMYFMTDPGLALRHPSQLYEAFFEGLVLFLILWKFRNSEKLKGKIFSLYIISYAIFRFFIEFFREPETRIGHITDFLTIGQILSLIMIVFGIIIWYNRRNVR